MSLMLVLGEQNLLNRFENLVKRLSLISTHLLTIVSKSEADLLHVKRTVTEGHKIVENILFFKQNIEDLLERFIGLLHFVHNREDIIKVINKELKRIKKELGAEVNVNMSTADFHYKLMEDFLHKEKGQLELVKYLHKWLVDSKEGHFIKLYNLIKGKENIFPEEHMHLIHEFLFYLRKLVGAFHELNKVFLRMESLVGEEENDFQYLYNLLGEHQGKEHEMTEVQKTITILEKEFD